MPKGFRARLEPASHRVVALETRRPLFCLALSGTVTIILATVFAVSAWNLRQHKFNQNMLDFHNGDEVAASVVCNDFSSVFCDAFEISLWERASVYLLPDTAQVNTSDKVSLPFTMNQIPTRFENFRAFYLLEGSSIVLDACRQNGSRPVKADICVLKGRDGFRRYHDARDTHVCLVHQSVPVDARCEPGDDTGGPVHLQVNVSSSDTYFLVVKFGRQQPFALSSGRDGFRRYHDARDTHVCLVHQSVPVDARCEPGDDTGGPVHLQVNVSSSDTYFLVVKFGRMRFSRGRRPSELGVLINGTLTRTRYDISHAERMCDAREKKDCSFPLPWASHKDIVMQFGALRGDNVKTSFVSKCHLRLPFWIGLFGGVPLVVSAAASVFLGLLFCRKRRRNMASARRVARKKANKPGERSALVHNEVIAEDGGTMAIQDD
ncbi:uncharacterized protein LOC101861717 [Aplysia californica]|uniref:Uncharacterized protein LOC101861717 n=1 Tax=Aplysia californica TaxID=6500 RepID=A0ABM1VP25_APLCA|nr:uncharacterized protein LOC101861717 [Aplysia californica]